MNVKGKIKNLTLCLSYFSIAVMKHHEHRQPRSQFVTREVRAETEAQAVEEHCLLACSLWLFPLLSHSTQDHQPTGGMSHGGLDPPISVINHENDL